MDKRIRIVSILTIVTVVLVGCGQAYWLLNQLQYQYERTAGELFVRVDSLCGKEMDIRGNQSSKKKKGVGSYIHRLVVKMHADKNQRYQSEGAVTVERRDLVRQRVLSKRVFSCNSVSAEGLNEMAVRYVFNQANAFTFRQFDSLLVAHHFPPSSNGRFVKLKHPILRCSYRYEASLLHPFIEVTYPYNPIENQGVRFQLPIPCLPVLQRMWWQLLGSLFLTVVLVCCLVFQLKTIFFQKRIDALRRGFMKNIIYELKAPTADAVATDDNGVQLGNTRFVYSLNELHTPTGQVMITSRQAEILRLLAEQVGELVPRAKILDEVWGDDSYANSMALNVQITYLRRALRGDDTLSIDVVMKKGYMLKVV